MLKQRPITRRYRLYRFDPVHIHRCVKCKCVVVCEKSDCDDEKFVCDREHLPIRKLNRRKEIKNGTGQKNQKKGRSI